MDQLIEKEKRFCAQNYHPLPVVISKGKGSYLWDDSGKQYIDMMCAYSAVSHGHCHPRVVKVLQQQAETLALTSRAFYNDKMALLLEKLCHISKMDKAILMNTGTEAVETAIKAARLWAYKHKGVKKDTAEIIVAGGNFHGRSTTVISFSDEPAYKEDFGPLTPGFIQIPFGNALALKEAINEHTCAFLVEPIQGEGGIIVPPDGWLQEVQAICKQHNILLILDEVQSGLGRTGKLFAFEHEIDKPDGLILGKALGGGLLPISAFLAKSEIMDLFTPGSHGSTFGGNPLASAVALEALNVIEEEKLVENSLHLGEYLMNGLKNLSSPLIKELRGRGLWIGLEIDTSKINAREFCAKLMQEGILTKETHHTVIRIAPPLVVTKNIIDHSIRVIDKVLNEVVSV